MKLDGGFTERVIGLINDDSTEVGSVHLGVVHVVSLENPGVRPGEKAITEVGLLRVEELRSRRENLETWSQIVLDHWEDIG